MERSIKNVQDELLVLADRFHRFCIDNGVYYSIHGGTMLGAVREKGFIAWDDDIDVTFTRNEYNRFRKAFREKSMDEVVLNERGLYPRLIMKRSGHLIVWIDIFIYDYITDNRLLRKYKITRLKLFNLMFRDPETLVFTKQNSKKNKLRYAFISALVWYGNKTDRKRLLKKAYKVMVSFPGRKNWLCRTNDTIVGMPKIVPGYSMNQYELIQFEALSLMISSYWDAILTVSYGADYMIPRKTTDNHMHRVFVDIEESKAEQALSDFYS